MACRTWRATFWSGVQTGSMMKMNRHPPRGWFVAGRGAAPASAAAAPAVAAARPATGATILVSVCVLRPHRERLSAGVLITGSLARCSTAGARSAPRDFHRTPRPSCYSPCRFTGQHPYSNGRRSLSAGLPDRARGWFVAGRGTTTASTAAAPTATTTRPATGTTTLASVCVLRPTSTPPCARRVAMRGRAAPAPLALLAALSADYGLRAEAQG